MAFLIVSSFKIQAECKPTSSTPSSTDLSHEIDGFCVIFTDKASPQNDPLHSKFLDLLKSNLADLKKMSPELSRIKDKISIWVTNANWQPSASVSHFSPAWLKEHKMSEKMAPGIEITNTENYLKWAVKEDQPLMFIHEAAHVYMFLFLESKKDKIEELYKSASDKKIYEKVDYHHGENKLRAYALTNSSEYFAELTEAYYGANDYYPYTKDDLKKHDPAAFEFFSEIYK